MLIRKQYSGRKITDITDITVVTDFIENWHLQDHGRLSEVLWCCGVLCGCMRVLCCVMHCELCCLVCCVVVVLCVVCCVVCGCFISLFFFSILFFLFLALSLFLSCSFLFLSCLPLSLLSSLLANKHCVKHWSTNMTSNFEAFACDLEQGRCTALASQFTASLPPPLPSLLPSPPLPTHKNKGRELFITGIFPARELFCITVLFSIRKKSTPGEIADITVWY